MPETLPAATQPSQKDHWYFITNVTQVYAPMHIKAAWPMDNCPVVMIRFNPAPRTIKNRK
jgi:hypothetical protein